MGESTAVNIDPTLLLPLMERTEMLNGSGRLHQDVWSIGASAGGWARRAGLIVGEPDTSPLERARFERLAARVFTGLDLRPRHLEVIFVTLTRISCRPPGRAA